MGKFRITKETKTDKETTFIMKHRWILEAKHLSPHYQTNVKVDILNQEITFESLMIQNEEYSAQNWVMDMKEEKYEDETIRLSHYNAAGEGIMQRDFQGLKVIGHKCFFDYEDSTVATDTICVKFEKITDYVPIICPLTGLTHWQGPSKPRPQCKIEKKKTKEINLCTKEQT